MINLNSSLATPTTLGPPDRGIPLSRIITTELRKMLDTRSGSWLMASIGLLALLVTVGVILFTPAGHLTYRTFTSAVTIPMTTLLPLSAILSVTSEWSQRTGLTTFTLVPNRGRVIAAKAIACVAVAVVAIPVAFGIGAIGNLVGAFIVQLEPIWDLGAIDLATMALANVLSLLFGFMLGVLIRNPVGALMTYFVYQFLLPTLSLILAASQPWFRNLQPWIDFDHAQSALLTGAMTSHQWTHLAVTGIAWLALPMCIGLAQVMRADIK